MAAVLAVALGRAVALQQAALAIVHGVLHRVLLPVCPMMVLYHAVEGGSAGLIQGSRSPFPTGAARGKPGEALVQQQELGDIPSTTASQGTLVTSPEVHMQQNPTVSPHGGGLLRVFLELLSLQ